MQHMLGSSTCMCTIECIQQQLVITQQISAIYQLHWALIVLCLWTLYSSNSILYQASFLDYLVFMPSAYTVKYVS
jgi:hypothetical protein